MRAAPRSRLTPPAKSLNSYIKSAVSRSRAAATSRDGPVSARHAATPRARKVVKFPGREIGALRPRLAPEIDGVRHDHAARAGQA